MTARAATTTGPELATCGLLPQAGDEVLLTNRAGTQFSGQHRVYVTGVRAAMTEGFCYLDVADPDPESDRVIENLFCRIAGLTVYPHRR